MKNSKYIIVTLICSTILATSSLASDSLSKALTNGKVNGEFKTYYYKLDTGVPNEVRLGQGDSSILSTGIKLGYITDSFNDLRIGTTFQSNFAQNANNDTKNLFAKDMYGTGAVLSEAYLDYTLNKTNMKIGRQFIGAFTPIVRGSRSRMIEESFEGIMLTNRDIPSTILTGGYISKFQARTTAAAGKTTIGKDSKIPSFNKKIVLSKSLGGKARYFGTTAVPFDGAYTISAINKSIKHTTLVGEYLKVNDVSDGTNIANIYIEYAEIQHVIPMNGFNFGLDSMYLGSQTGSALDSYNLSGHYIGLRAKVNNLNGMGVALAYGTTSKSDAVIAGIGNGPFVYTGTKIGGPITAIEKNTNSYSLEFSYNWNTIGIKGLKTSLMYAYAKQKGIKNISPVDRSTVLSIDNIDCTSKVFTAYYDIPQIKGLGLELEYETNNNKTATSTVVDRHEMRFRTKYKF